MNLSELGVWMEQSLPEVLPAFLLQRRWFAGKARPIAGVEFEDAAWLPDEGRPCALVVVRVRDSVAEETSYALLVAFDGDAATLPVVGRVEQGGASAWVLEAATDARAALALLRGFASSRARGLPMLRGGRLRYHDAGDEVARALDSASHVQQIGAEQSNTSLRIDRTLAFKLFRRLEGGENPELEIGRFLATHTTFRAMPLLRGALTYVPALGLPATLGVLQDWIESRGDGWSHVVGLLRQRNDSASGALQEEALSLGATTESFHRALATADGQPTFAPEPATRADVDEWRQSVADRLLRAADLVARHMPAWPISSRSLGQAFVDRSRDPTVIGRLPDPEQSSSRFKKIRVHGDYHLGQTLRADRGFVLIDFEGEPARPLAERRSKQAALKDIAGMLRSFDYAVEAALVESGVREGEAPVAEVLRHRFLDGYRAAFAHSPAEFVPANPSAVDTWIDFFEMERALYEVEYEINHRPTWVHIPLRGLVRIVGGRPEREEQ